MDNLNNFKKLIEIAKVKYNIDKKQNNQSKGSETFFEEIRKEIKKQQLNTKQAKNTFRR